MLKGGFKYFSQRQMNNQACKVNMFVKEYSSLISAR